MYPSNTYSNNPIPYIYDQTNTPFLNDNTNPNSSSLFNYPSSPYVHYEDHTILLQHLHDLLHQQQQPVIPAVDTVAMDVINNKAEDLEKSMADLRDDDKISEQKNPRKRTSKKDRHSKIDTAHGPRDRRMRLSLKVARKFFDLQDMLGFDKASKTVEWLLTMSNTAIKDVVSSLYPSQHNCNVGADTPSSVSECEVVSGIDESSASKNRHGSSGKGKVPECLVKEKKVRAPRKGAFNPLAKEMRERARERARERTREKRMLDELHLGETKDESKKIECGEDSGTRSGNKINPCFAVVADHEADQEPISCEQNQLGTQEDMVGDSWVIPSNWSPFIFNYQHNTGMPQEHQNSDFQIYGRPWEANNININLQ